MAAIITYLKESYDELMNKVTWPTWKELQESTVLTFISILVFGALIFLMDFAFGKGIIKMIYDFIA
ncbi:MAG: preprotein translocase subunit SecE [Flavobacteriales bacterium]|nr:preprotein translocase subunit SecE [Flavobacteriales bacterium]MDP4716924.1 preprotein translocase subunit SecE [Flavobacteriales bacterium]MDP4731330.1 preprotein translocase subunit SecE [Flavobacteriales bacterium]MDP4818761.1 preprotein translocase subunit SecE [Flavobacteriales bacterium]MDP4951319.1 preprotein translocase subunit SecE [Flavobacteriales bacterium]